MARSKRSTALYEVISASRQYPRPPRLRQTSLFTRAKRWWNQPRPPADVVSEIVRREAIEPTPPPAPAIEEPLHEEFVAAAPPSSSSKPVDFAVDPERKQIALRITYNTAMLAGAALVLVVAMSIAIGKYLTRSSTPLLARTTTAQLLKNPAHREVLDIAHHTNGSVADNTSAPTHVTAGGRTLADLATHTPVAASDSNKRRAGLNYAIIQSYPETESKMANDAAAYLNSHDVPCTVEQKIKGFGKICVVGTDGFPKQSSPEFKEYVEKILQLNQDYAATPHSFKQFAPVAKKWDKLQD